MKTHKLKKGMKVTGGVGVESGLPALTVTGKDSDIRLVFDSPRSARAVARVILSAAKASEERLTGQAQLF
jgi:hypothetical protein